jgi:hypothetical protein
MLDDCNGRRFEEVLAIFSTAVLKRVLLEKKDVTLPLAVKSALTKRLAQKDYENLVPLILAHASSLSHKEKHKTHARECIKNFSRLLDDKAAELENRSRIGKQCSEERAGSQYVVREISDNWLGNDGWINALLQGGPPSHTDGILEGTFEDAWIRAQNSQEAYTSRFTSVDLMLDLSVRVSEQRERLIRWQRFQKSMPTHDSIIVVGKQEVESGDQLLFRNHQPLSSNSQIKPVEGSGKTIPFLNDHHTAILSSMEKALASISDQAIPRQHLEADDPKKASQLGSSAATRPVHTQTKENTHPDSLRIPVNRADIEQEPPLNDSGAPSFSANGNDFNYSPQHNSFKAALAVFNRAFKEDEAAKELTTSHPSESHVISRPSIPFQSTLMERTRLSISLAQIQQSSRSRQSMFASKPPRPSQKFPVNQWNTPPKQAATPQNQQNLETPAPESGSSTPRDEIFSGDADYASVFKSRPRIALSPVFTPENNAHEPSISEEFEEDTYFTASPLAGRRKF